MTIWQIISIVCGVITVIAFLFMLIGLLLDDKDFKDRDWYMLLVGIFIIPFILYYCGTTLYDYLLEVWKDGGFIKHCKIKKNRKLRDVIRERERKKDKTEYDRITNVYKNGILTRNQLPRSEDGIRCFELYLILVIERAIKR